MPRLPLTTSRISEVNSALSRFYTRMPTPCSRYRRQGQKCLIDIHSGHYKRYNDNKKKCDLRVTFKEFKKLAKAREVLSKRVKVAENKLEKAEAEVVAAHEKVLTTRRKARLAYRLLRTSEK